MKFTHILPYHVGREALLAGAWHMHLDQLDQLIKGVDEQYTIDSNVLLELVTRYLEKDYDAKLKFLTAILGRKH